MASTLMFPVTKSTALMAEKMENNSTVTAQQSWRDLPHDILLLISSNFSLLDLLSLTHVCSSWRIAMKNRIRTAYPALVILAQPKEKLMKMSDQGTDGSIDNEFFFLCIKEKIKYKLKLRPWFVDQYSSSIIGSHPDGWVILSKPATWQYSYQYREVYLVHLFSEIQIQLPNNMMGANKALVEFIGGSIRKATLSANGQEHFIVAITFYNGIRDNALALWRYGDCNWTCFGGVSRRITDIAVCNNTIYALRGSGSFGKHLETWELKRNLSLPEKRLCIELPQRFNSDHEFQCLHVPSADEIYVVEFTRFSQNRHLFICKLDSNEKQWIRVHSLNGQALLSCFGNSAIISSSDVERLGYKANSIYLVKKEQKHIRVSIYHINDGKGNYELNETKSCMRDEYQRMLPFGLFLRST